MGDTPLYQSVRSVSSLLGGEQRGDTPLYNACLSVVGSARFVPKRKSDLLPRRRCKRRDASHFSSSHEPIESTIADLQTGTSNDMLDWVARESH